MTMLPSTATTDGARSHARAQAGAVVEHMAVVPASRYDRVPPDVDAESLVWAERVAGGGYTSRVLAPGTTIRFTDLDGDACAHLLAYRADQPWERLCVADTVKVGWQAYTSTGQLLLSDQGRVLATVIADSSGHHDALCGTSSRRRNEKRYGDGSPQGRSPAGRELFLLAAAKHGLSVRDLPPSLSLFKGVRVEPTIGALQWIGSRPAAEAEAAGEGAAAGPAAVELRAEVPLLLLVANTAHPVDPRPEWTCSTLEILAWSGTPTAIGDWAWGRTPEGERAFLNTVEDLRARVPA